MCFSGGGVCFCLSPCRHSCELAGAVDDDRLRLKRNCNGERIPPYDGEASTRFTPLYFLFYIRPIFVALILCRYAIIYSFTIPEGRVRATEDGLFGQQQD